MSKIIIIITLGLMLSGCGTLAVGAAAGVATYRYNKCSHWVMTPYGQRKVWTCQHVLHGD